MAGHAHPCTNGLVVPFNSFGPTSSQQSDNRDVTYFDSDQGTILHRSEMPFGDSFFHETPYGYNDSKSRDTNLVLTLPNHQKCNTEPPHRLRQSDLRLLFLLSRQMRTYGLANIPKKE